MAEAKFLKVWASVLAAVLAAGLLATTAFAPGAAAQDTACRRPSPSPSLSRATPKGGSSPAAPGRASSRWQGCPRRGSRTTSPPTSATEPENPQPSADLLTSPKGGVLKR